MRVEGVQECTPRRDVGMNGARSHGRSRPRPLQCGYANLIVVLGYAVFASLWILFSDALLGAIVSDRVSLVAASTLKGWAFVGITSLLLYRALAIVARPAPALKPPPVRAKVARISYAMASVGVIAAGATAIDVILDRHLAAQQKQLEAIARLKAREIEAWLSAERREAELIMSSWSGAEFLARVGKTDDSAGRQGADAIIASLRELLRDPSIRVVDRNVKLLAGMDAGIGLPAATREAAVAGILEQRAISTDLQLGEESTFFIDHIVPIPTASGSVTTAVILRSDGSEAPADLLTWPLPSHSGRIALVGKAADGIVLIGRGLSGSSSGLGVSRVSERDLDYIGNQVLTTTGEAARIASGRDHEGVAVVGMALPIEGSQWRLAAKIDEAEFYQEVHRDLAWIALAMALALVGTTGGFHLWRRQEALHWARQHSESVSRQVDLLAQVSSERAERLALTGHYRTLIEKARDIVLLVGQDGEILEANEAAATAYGWPLERLRGMRIGDLRAEETMTSLAEHWQMSESREGVLFETVHRRRDGTNFPVEVSSRAIEVDGQIYRQSFIRDISERKSAEEALRRSEERYRELFEGNPSPMWVYDRESLRILAVNQAAVGHYGYARDEFLAMSIDSLQPAASPGRMQVDGEVYGSGLLRAGVIRHLRKDGSEIFVDLMTQPIEFDERSAMMVLAVDVTARIQREQLIHLENERARILLDLPRQAELRGDCEFIEHALDQAELLTGSELGFVHFISSDGNAIESSGWSRRTREAFRSVPWEKQGRLRDADFWREARHTRMPLIVEPERMDQAAFALPAAHAAIERFLVVPVVEGDRVVLIAGVGNRKSRYREQDVETVQLIVNDLWRIIQRRRSQTELQKLSMAVEQSQESIVITDLRGNIEYVNDALVTVSGYARSELLGRNCRMLQSGKTPRATYEDLWRHLASEKPWKGEFINRRKDGSEYVEFALLSPIRQTGGQVTHYVAVMEDITEKKRVAAELNEYRHRLEELVEARTQQLSEARKRAEDASRAKSAFLANMSHEVRTPLNAIIGLGHLMLRDIEDPSQLARIQKMDSAAKHLLSIINDILDLSKVEAGRLQLDEIDFELRSVTDYVRSIIQESATSKGLAVHVECADLPFWLRGDPLRLRQALLNYAANAVKFTAEGSVTLRVSECGTRHGESLMLRFEVSDTGIGIAPDEAASLFVAFEQGKRDISRRFGGTGLGLAITKKLAQLMGGNVGVDSEPGVGSTFWFTAAVQIGNQTPDTLPAPSPDMAEARLRSDHAGARALLVEDNPVNRELAAEMLELAGLSVLLAENGRIAVDRLQEQAVDIILMDLQMPEMDGFEATRIIRTSFDAGKLPILAMSANASDADRSACLAAGMNDLIAKPVMPERLYETVGAWLSAARESARLNGVTQPAKRTGLPPVTLAEDQAGTVGRDATDFSRLDELSGFDLAGGLRLARGNTDRYRSILKLFVATHSSDSERIATCLSEGRRVDALRIAHSLKGSAAMIGARALAESAGSLESGLAGNTISAADDTVAGTQLRELAERLREVCASASDVLRGADSALDAFRAHDPRSSDG